MSIMDRSVFVGMSGAESTMQELQVLANNLANATTVGFRADRLSNKPYPVTDSDTETRIYSQLEGVYTQQGQGPIITGQGDLDASIDGEGFFAVQTKDGREAYTRNGSFQITSDGLLVNQDGLLVSGLTGPITIPDDARKVAIGENGTISAMLFDNTEFTVLGQMKLVKPDANQTLTKGTDGMFYTADGSELKADPINTKMLSHTLEGSNVNTMEELTRMIDLTRRYESQMKLIKSLGDNATNANQLLSVR